MKIEQRCGRADRIGQQRDVHIYNFIIIDTVERRVHEVLEEKLSVILKEMGVDKYSDVLDSEVAEVDFTEVYMNSIGKPRSVEKNLYPVESEVKQQVSNVQKYKDIIREEKDLQSLVGTESDFDVDSALRQMMAYYESWKGHDLQLIDRISINDVEITKHLRMSLIQDHSSQLLSVGIKDFPNESGYFMLWELSISDEESGKRIIPIFVNEGFILRPMAGKRLMDVFLDGNSKLTIGTTPNITEDEYKKLEGMCMDFAYDTFVELKDKQIQTKKESYNKYMYALQLRTEAAEHIGIENIRRSRLAKLEREIKSFVTDHRDEMGKTKSMVLTFGEVGFRLSTSVSLPRANEKLEEIIRRLKSRQMTDCIVVEEKVSKEALKKYGEDTVNAVGATWKQSDVFGYEVNIAKLEQIKAGN